MTMFSDKTSGLTVPCGKSRRQISSEMKIELSPTRKQRVLLVEDEPLVMLAEKQMIKSQGCEVDGAANGEVAVRAVKEKNLHRGTKYDLVLMDINMPVMNGYAASRCIKDMARRGEIIDVPIVCLSAQDSLEHRERCAASGIIELGIYWQITHALVEKPIEAVRLRELLAKYNTND